MIVFKAWLLISIACSASVAANPVVLTDLYQASLRNDASYRAASYQQQAASEGINQAKAGFRPQVSLNGRYGNGGQLDDEDKSSSLQSEAYRTNALTLQLSQSIYDKKRWVAEDQAQIRAELGNSLLNQVDQELFDRVIAAYFDLARIENELELNQQQKTATQALSKQSEQLFKFGEGTITDLEEAQARLDFIEAQQIELQSRRQSSLRNLSHRSGLQVEHIVKVSDQLTEQPLVSTGNDLSYWLKTAEDNSPTLTEQRQRIALASTQIELQQAGHHPTLSLVSQLSRVSNNNSNRNNQNSSQHQTPYYIGLSLDVPLYQGGAVSASVRQALAEREQARAQYDANQQQLTEEIETSYWGVLNGYQKTRALTTAVRSTQQALNSATKGYQAGARSTQDILDAQQRLYGARRDLLNAKLDMLQNYASLHSRSGQMNLQVLQKIQQWF